MTRSRPCAQLSSNNKTRKRPIACQHCRDVKLKCELRVVGNGKACDRCYTKGLVCGGPVHTPQRRQKDHANRAKSDAAVIHKRARGEEKKDLTRSDRYSFNDFAQAQLSLPLPSVSGIVGEPMSHRPQKSRDHNYYPYSTYSNTPENDLVNDVQKFEHREHRFGSYSILNEQQPSFQQDTLRDDHPQFGGSSQLWDSNVHHHQYADERFQPHFLDAGTSYQYTAPRYAYNR